MIVFIVTIRQQRMCLLLFQMFPCFTSHGIADDIAYIACLLDSPTPTDFVYTATSAAHVYASYLPSLSKLRFHRRHSRYQ